MHAGLLVSTRRGYDSPGLTHRHTDRQTAFTGYILLALQPAEIKKIYVTGRDKQFYLDVGLVTDDVHPRRRCLVIRHRLRRADVIYEQRAVGRADPQTR